MLAVIIVIARLFIHSSIHSFTNHLPVPAESTDWPLHQTRLPGVKSLVYLYQVCDLRKGFSVPYFSGLENGSTNRFYLVGCCED